MRPPSSLEDSNYGVRSLSDSFSDGSSNSTIQQDDLHPSSHPSTLATSSSSTSPVYQPQPELLQYRKGIPSLLPRDAFIGSPPPPSPCPPSLPLPSSTSSPIGLSPPLSPVNSYSSISSSSPPTMSNYLSESVSSLGSLQNELTSSGLSSAAAHSPSIASSSRHQTPGSDQGGGSNGNLVLPMLPSGLMGRDAGDEEVERELRDAETSMSARPTTVIATDLRIVVVAGRDDDRDMLVERLASELGVQLGEESHQREGWKGKSGRTRTTTDEGDEASREVWVGMAGSDLSSIELLLSHIQSRHHLLAHQLSPRSEQPSLGTKDVLQLASTGKGRGPRGWIDCCLVVVEDDAPSSFLSAARILSSFVPTLLVLFRSKTDSPFIFSPELASTLHRLELVSPTLLPITASSTSKLLILDRTSHSTSHTSDETGSEGLPTPQPGNDDPFAFPPSRREDPPFSPLTLIQTLFATDKGVAYLHRFAARGFMRSRAAIPRPPVPVSNADTTLPSDSLSSSMTSDAFPPRPKPIPLAIEEPSFDPLHLPSALSNLFVPTLKTATSFILEGLGIIAIGMLSIVAQSVFLGVVGEVARRLDLRGAFGRRARC